MATRHQKPTLEDRRKGENALSEFADYVQSEQARRSRLASANGHTLKPNLEEPEHHDELDIIDTLGLSDAAPPIRLRTALLDDNPSTRNASIAQLRTTLDRRLDEGHGETPFDIGTEDSGEDMALTNDEWHLAWTRLQSVAKDLQAQARLLMTKNVGGDAELPPPENTSTSSTTAPAHKTKYSTGKAMIRRDPQTPDDVIELRIAVVGNVDAGKSTMLGVLVKGGLDDGRGKARVNLFRHKHELESGRTSSVGMEIMGFDTSGDVVASTVPGRKLSWEEIGKRSAKVISFTDLAGHERYLRTTVFGLLSSEPNYCLLMVAANNGLIGMSKEHLGIALALNVPVLVIITKIDICPPHILAQTLTQLQKLLKSPGARKIPILINDRETCISTATQFVSQRICPIFQVSNVTGQSLDLVRLFLNMLPHVGNYDATAPFEFHVNDTFSVPFVGTVVSGVVKSGMIHAGDPVLIGPDSLGNFINTTIRSIERKRIPAPVCSAGQSASFALKRVRRKDVRKGMVVLPKVDAKDTVKDKEASTTSTTTDTPVHAPTKPTTKDKDPPTGPPKVHREFTAEVLILSHATTIKTKYQAMLHVGPVSQTCAIIDIDRSYIRTGDRALVAFRFVQRPEFLQRGDRILFREGRTKGLGIVKGLGYDPMKPLNPERKAEVEKGQANGGVREKGKG